jgi:ABC-type Mn2+/Zn2+ transport system permease subunit
MLALATGFAVGSTVLGTLAAPLIDVAAGPLVIAIAAGGFMVGLVLRRGS